MKSYAVSLLVFFLSFSVFADAAPVMSTVLSCRQTLGQSWFQVGLVPLPGSENSFMMVVLKDLGETHTQVAYQFPVVRTAPDMYSTFRGDVRLSTQDVGPSSVFGIFTVNNSNFMGVENVEVSCVRNSSISFDRVAIPQPRISVGN